MICYILGLFGSYSQKVVYAAKISKESKLHVLEVTQPVGSSPKLSEVEDLGTVRLYVPLKGLDLNHFFNSR